MIKKNAIYGWNDRKTVYCCADRVEVRVKRQETVRFTRKEEVRYLWENKYNEILMAVGPRNGVVCRFQDGML